MKKHRFLYILTALFLLLSVLAGCAADTPEETTALSTTLPTEDTEDTRVSTTAPSEEETQDTTIPDDSLINKYQALFSDWSKYYRKGLYCTYEDPTQIDLTVIFYGQLDTRRDLTDAEKAHLLETGFILEMDVQIHSASFMDEFLQELFGIGLSQLPDSAFGDLHYWEDTDCYYSNHNDAYGIDLNVTDVTVLEDGRIQMTYEDTSQSWVTPAPTFVAIFAEDPDGAIQFYSNLPKQS